MRHAAAAAVVLAAVLCLPALAARDDLALVSRASDGTAAQGNSNEASLSAEGRLVAFASNADNLSDADDDAVFNIFVRDLGTGATTLASRQSGPGGPGADGDSAEPAISADGRIVAFSTLADDLVTGEDESVRNIFVRDRVAGVTTFVSRAGGAGGAAGDGDSFDPAVSRDGRFVAFSSDADNLSDDDAAGVMDVFLRDLALGTTTLVSRATGPAGAGGDGTSSRPSISADGRLVAFTSDADNISGEDDDGYGDVFVRDVALDTIVLASRAAGPGGPGGNGLSNQPAISADGRVVAFQSGALNLSVDDLDPGGDVFARDLAAATTTFVSRATGAAGAGGDADSEAPAVSADGRFVAFASSATNLSPPDTNPERQVLVRDLAAATTTLVSRATGAAGAPASGSSTAAAISADGRYAAFTSLADNLSGEDVDVYSNVYLRDVLGDPPGPSPPGAGPAPAGPPRPAPAARCAGRRATIVGTARQDVIRGTARADVVASLGGNDVVRGLAGADLICLGPGADRALGGPGPDRLLGGPGRDRLLGGPGRDRALGGPGRDACAVERRTAC